MYVKGSNRKQEQDFSLYIQSEFGMDWRKYQKPKDQKVLSLSSFSAKSTWTCTIWGPCGFEITEFGSLKPTVSTQ